MDFSIIVPFYNSQTYIEQCIESVIRQTNGNFEILLIDDGSTDGSVERIKKYLKDSRIKLIQKDNGGVSSARNLGIKKAKGKWITFLDSDDWLDEDFLENAQRIISKHNRIDIIIYNLSLNGENKDIKENLFLIDSRVEKNKLIDNILCYEYNAFKYQNKYGNCRCIGGKIYKQEVISKIKFPLGIKVCEDGIFNLEAINNSENICLNSLPMYNYRLNNGSASHVYNESSENQLKSILSLFQDRIDLNSHLKAYSYCQYDFFVISIFSALNQKYKFNYFDNKRMVRNKLEEYKINDELLRKLNNEYMIRRKVKIKNALIKNNYFELILLVKLIYWKDRLKEKIQK